MGDERKMEDTVLIIFNDFTFRACGSTDLIIDSRGTLISKHKIMRSKQFI